VDLVLAEAEEAGAMAVVVVHEGLALLMISEVVWFLNSLHDTDVQRNVGLVIVAECTSWPGIDSSLVCRKQASYRTVAAALGTNFKHLNAFSMPMTPSCKF